MVGDSGISRDGPSVSRAFGDPTASTLSWYEAGAPITLDSDGVPLKPGRRVADPGIEKWRLIILTSAMLGVQCCYSVQINRGSSTLQLLGVDEKKVSLAWLAGPLSGLIVQPIVGVASDACTLSLGRRRPFLIGGAILTSIALVLFANADWLGPWLAGSPGIVGSSSADLVNPAGVQMAIILAVSGFFLLDFSIQAIQAPLRALVTDVASERQQPLGNSYIGLMTGMGNLVGSFLSSVRLVRVMPWFRTSVQALFSLAATILLVTVGLCVWYVKEEPIIEEDEEEGGNAEASMALVDVPGTSYGAVASASAVASTSALAPVGEDEDEEAEAEEEEPAIVVPGASLVTMLSEAPRPFWRIFTVQLFTWYGFFTLFVFVNTWVGRNVFLGSSRTHASDQAHHLFRQGVRLGGVGNCLTALVTVFYSPLITPLLARFGTLKVYAFSQLVEAVCLGAAFFIRGTAGQTEPSLALKAAALTMMASFGVVWATTMAVPWALVGAALNRRFPDRIGLFTTLFNVSQSFPQLFVSLGSPWILGKVGGDVSVVMSVGAVFALVGLVLIFALRVDLFDDDVEEEDQ